MTLFQFEEKVPTIGEGTYVALSAEVIGGVTIGDKCYIGSGAKIRGDYTTIHIGNQTSVQENCVIHARYGETCTIGDNVTIGHGAIIHGSIIKNNIIIGMGAIISDGAIINDHVIIGAGAVVRERQTLEEGSLAVGVPCKVIREVSESQKMFITSSAEMYCELAQRYLQGLKKIK
ncbi:MAG: gamma carbonic anhydrase family protein [Candidatus Heimdallarchaeota archaeon]|nr:MAG: gamma carbonic anhydrase family protein [Candidatus Heimdallarchaeota archaeon]